MLTPTLHKIAAHPAVYDFIQVLFGARITYRLMAERVERFDQPDLVIDVGGGTGFGVEVWPTSTTYVCLDLDSLKLGGFKRKHPEGLAIQGDGTQLPIASRAADVVMCVFVAHHLPDDTVSGLVAECIRLLKPGGRLLFLDPLWSPRRWQSRLLWRYDRGSYPRTEEYLHRLISDHSRIVHWEQYKVVHAYVLCMATPVDTI